MGPKVSGVAAATMDSVYPACGFQDKTDRQSQADPEQPAKGVRMATRNGIVSKFKFTYLRHRSKQRMKSQQFTRTAMGAPEQWLIEAATSIGLDYAGLSHAITNFFLNHVINRHGSIPDFYNLWAADAPITGTPPMP
jgi:hypothetical protein